MLETLKVIAILCQINSGANTYSIDFANKKQMDCHKYYSFCIEKEDKILLDYKLFECVKKRSK